MNNSAMHTCSRMGYFPEALYLSWLKKDERKQDIEKGVEGGLSDREQQMQLLGDPMEK